MFAKIPIGKSLVAVTLIFFLLEAALAGFLYLTKQKTTAAALKADRSQAIVFALERSQACYMDAGPALIFYGITQQEPYLKKYEEKVKAVETYQQELETLLKDEPARLQQITAIKQAGKEAFSFSEELKSSMEESSGNPLSMFLGGGNKKNYGEIANKFTGVLKAGTDFIAPDIATQESGEKERQSGQELGRGIFFAMLAVAFLSIFITGLIIFGALLSPLRALLANGVLLDQGQPLNPPLKGSNEVAAFDQALYEAAALNPSRRSGQSGSPQPRAKDLSQAVQSTRTLLQQVRSGLYGETSTEGNALASKGLELCSTISDKLEGGGK